MSGVVSVAKLESYQELVVWQASVELAVRCYSVTKEFPSSELYGMTSQIRRSSTSVAANIAEGYGRETTGSFVQFLRVAQGSLKELETLFVISGRVGLIEGPVLAGLSGEINDVGKMLRSMIRSLQLRVSQ